MKRLLVLGVVLAAGLPGTAYAGSNSVVISDPLEQPCFPHSFCTPDIAGATAAYDPTAGSVEVTVTFKSPVPGQQDPGVPGYEVKVALARSASGGHCGNILGRDISSGLAVGDVLLRGFVAGQVSNPQWAQGDLQIGGVARRLEVARTLSADGRTLEYGFQRPELVGSSFWCFEVSENLVTDEATVSDGTQLVTFDGTMPAPNISGIVAAHVTSSAAEIDATIDPDGTPASAHVEYGTTAAYGSASAGSAEGPTPGALAVQLHGLRAGTTYHYRVVATGSTGSSTSPDQTFVTQGGAPLRLAVKGSLARGSLARCGASRALPHASYRWLRGASLIPSATASTYRISSADLGTRIRCRVSYVAPDGRVATGTSPARRSPI